MSGKQAKILLQHHASVLLNYACTRRNPEIARVIVLLSLKAGMRAGEIAKLTWDMIITPSGDINSTIELRDSVTAVADNTSIFNTNNPISESLNARIVRDDQRAARRVSRNLRQHSHDSMAVFGVQCGSRLVRENDRWIPDNSARDSDTLLLAAAQFARIGFGLIC